ncbi:hypothetical protein D3C81_1673890 [compost metagenome]
MKTQLDLDRRIQVVAHVHAVAARLLLDLQVHLAVEVLVHPVAEYKHLGPTGRPIAIGHHAIGVLGLVDGRGHGQARGHEQATANQQSREHGQHSVGAGLR